MAVILVHAGPTLTQERYEEAVRKVSGGKASLQSPADWPVEGLLVHAAGQGKDASGWWICGSPRRRPAGSARSWCRSCRRSA